MIAPPMMAMIIPDEASLVSSRTTEQPIPKIVGNMSDMQRGLIPDDAEMVGALAADISYSNAKLFSGFT